MTGRQRPLRLGMVGGGTGALIGRIHRIAARIDGEWEFVAGSFDIDPQRGHDFAKLEGIDPARSYSDYNTMAEGERNREDRVDAVAICTPNHTHYMIAKCFLEAGFDVICEKPLTSTLEDAVALERLVKKTGRFMGVNYTYSGYPLVHEARSRVARGDIGKIRTVQIEYPLEWMATALEREGNAQAEWRTDPKKSGRGGSIGDIGTHAYHLAGFVSGLKLESLIADVTTFVKGRNLDDNAHVMLRYHGGARGLLWSSQVAIGHSNGIKFRIFGETGSLSWAQEEPNSLMLSLLDGRTQVIKRADPDMSDAARVRIRTPAGLPEGYIEAIGNLYTGFAEAIRARRENRSPSILGQDLPSAYDGLCGVAFVDAVIDCCEADSPRWTIPAFT